ncbi:hypothetical protein AVEN_39594-1 [Araneus ventricosus]|uniref:Uncharacterized protein n=1 Tax=Araneus ventricosus TaxID=182803 RepID=A0A4Y2UM17_ARAVE|nr:hypothetical protein AVEN_240542-1 [Araneus ventricosus]GBO12707.1 hypothetical protein AVEN_39594-1 [Araneus ventricosus]
MEYLGGGGTVADDRKTSKFENSESRDGLVVRSRLRGQTVSSSELDSTEDPPCKWDYYTLNHTYGAKHPTAGVVRKFEDWLLAQMSSSSSDRGSKLRGLSKTNSRVASKWDVNITKLSSESIPEIIPAL